MARSALPIALASLLFLLITCLPSSRAAPADDDKKNRISQEMAAGAKAMKEGNFKEYVSHLSSVIDMEPDADVYLSVLQKRAGALQVLKRYTAARSDWEAILLLKPDDGKALDKQASLFVQEGRIDAAVAAYESLIASGRAGAKQAEMQQTLQTLRNCLGAMQAARHYFSNGQWEEAIHQINAALETSSDHQEMLMLKANAHLNKGEHEEAIAASGQAIKARSDSVDAIYFRGHIYYSLGEYDLANKHMQQGLKMDPEHKKCKEMFRLLKKITNLRKAADAATASSTAAIGKDGALQAWDDLTSADPSSVRLQAARAFGKCQVYLKTQEWHSIIKHCNEASGFGEQHSSRETIARAHCGVGRAHVQLEEFEDAVRAYQRGKDVKGDDHEANEGHNNAQKLLKMSKRKDYYKILGIDKGSNEQQIKKAYRKLALVHHPDKQTDPAKKASSEKKFKEVADAYEVLMDPEKKQRFDNGEDLNEPQQQQNPFNGFGGGGFTFHFG